ncbi:hypothetical protein V8B97DRAFT_1923656 [Scleroderma yunnanense]
MAKKSIQRMKLERAVLYERLSAVPPSPDLHGHHTLPPMHPGPGVPPQHSQPVSTPMYHRDHSRGVDVNDHNAPDYIHSSGNVRVIPGPDGPIGPGVPPSHSISAVQMSRRSSSSGQDARQLPPFSQLTPVQHIEHQRPPVHSQGHSPHFLAHSVGPDSRSRSHSSSSRLRGPLPSQGPPHGYHTGGVPHPQQYPLESISPAQQGPHSPPLGHERPRRHESRERGNHDSHFHGHQQMPHPSSHSSMLSPTSTRGSSLARVHHHQRMGPGVSHVEYENERELEREREHDHTWSRQREHDYDREGPMREYPAHASPPPLSHMRSRLEYQEQPPLSSSYRQLCEHHPSSREPIGPGVYGRISRSDTPGSGSGSVSGNGNSSGNGGAGAGEGQSRLDHWDYPQYYDRERPRPYAPRAINHHQVPNEEIDYVHGEGRSAVVSTREHDQIGSTYLPSEQHASHPQQAHRSSMDTSRKRSRNDMEVDEDDVGLNSPSGNNSGGGEGPSSRYNSAPLRPDDRGSKRLHQEGISSQGHGEQQEHSD